MSPASPRPSQPLVRRTSLSLCLSMCQSVLLRACSRRRFVLVLAVPAAGVTAACTRAAPPLHARAHAAVPDTRHIAWYNRGTRLLAHDSLQAALPLLASALASPDSTVQFRAAFNDGWDYLVTGVRTFAVLQHGGPTAETLLATLARDTALQRTLTEDTADSAAVDSATNDSAASDSAVAPRRPAGPLSRQAQLALAVAYVNLQLDSAVAKYRTALIVHPSDLDAKWNYELALRLSKEAAGGKGKDKEKQKDGTQKRKKGKGKKGLKKKNIGKLKDKNKIPDKGKKKGPGTGHGDDKSKGANQQPPVEQLRLPPQQAEQLLNAVGQHELKAIKPIPVPTTPPPQGKDW